LETRGHVQDGRGGRPRGAQAAQLRGSNSGVVSVFISGVLRSALAKMAQKPTSANHVDNKERFFVWRKLCSDSTCKELDEGAQSQAGAIIDNNLDLGYYVVLSAKPEEWDTTMSNAVKLLNRISSMYYGNPKIKNAPIAIDVELVSPTLSSEDAATLAGLSAISSPVVRGWVGPNSGRKTIYYMSANQCLALRKTLSSMPCQWIAKYSRTLDPAPFGYMPPSMWQFAGDKLIEGVQGEVDLNGLVFSIGQYDALFNKIEYITELK